MATTSDYPTWPQPPQPPVASPGVGLRVAILVLGAGVGAYIVMQINMLMRFSVFLPKDENVLGQAGVVVLLWIMALAAVWGAPAVAALLFGAASVLGLQLGAGGHYGDMNVWGAVALILAGLCVTDWVRRSGRAAPRLPGEINARMHAMPIGRRLLAAVAGILVATALMRLAGL